MTVSEKFSLSRCIILYSLFRNLLFFLCSCNAEENRKHHHNMPHKWQCMFRQCTNCPASRSTLSNASGVTWLSFALWFAAPELASKAKAHQRAGSQLQLGLCFGYQRVRREASGLICRAATNPGSSVPWHWDWADQARGSLVPHLSKQVPQ